MHEPAETVEGLRCRVVAGAANNQLATEQDGERLQKRNILYAPDYVINAGGIIDVALEYLGRRAGQPHSVEEVNARIEQIPGRLEAIWRESEASGQPANEVADRMAQKLIMVGLLVSVGPQNGRYRLTADYGFQRIDRKVGTAKTPIEQSLVRLGVAVGF